MGQIKRFRKKKIEAKQRYRKFKSAILKLSLIMLNFIFATFAWFTYTRILDTTVDVHVSAWQIDFKDDETTLGNSLNFSVDNFYPGMTDYTKSIEIVNLGDRAASISDEIEELKILGQPYVVKETPEEGDSDYTLYRSESTDFATGIKTVKLVNDEKIPFQIILTYKSIIDIKDETNENANKGNFEIQFAWPYEVVVPEGETATEEQETEKNDLDTQWGYDIANFYETLPAEDTTHGIEIELQAIAKQII